MQRKLFTHWILGVLMGLGWISGSKAQTITTGSLAVSQLCVPSTLSVPFTKTGTFSAGNTFTVELSDPTGTFDAPRVLATSGTTSPLTATIPADVANGVGYRVRVVSSTPKVVGATGATALTLQQVPAAPTVAKTSYSYCTGATAVPLSATASAGNTIQWYDAGGSPIASAPVPPTATAGTQTYSVAQATSAGCTSPKVTITVQVNAPPAPPAASTPIQVCEGGTVAPLTASGTDLKWYDNADAPLPGAPTPSNTASSTFKVSQTVNGCESTKKTIQVTVTPKPAPPVVTATYTYCYGQSIPPLTATGSNLKWYGANNAPLGGTPTPSNTMGSSYKVSQTVNGCESDKATITVNINQTPAPTATNFIEYCIGEPAAPLAATGNNLKWYNAQGAALPSVPTPPTTAATTLEYYVTQTVNGCESDRFKITVFVKSIPAAPGVTPVTVCEDSSTPTLTATGSNLMWYRQATGGTGNDTPPVVNTGTPGASSYYVTQNVNGCESPRAKLDVTVKDTPDAPVVTAAISYCFGATAAPLTATGTNLKWYTANGSSLPSVPTPSTATAGSTTYQVSQATDGCEGPKATITVTVYQTGEPDVKSIAEYCTNEPAVALSATGTALKWYTSPTGGTASPTAPTPGTTTVGSSSYYVTQTLNNCEGPRALIKVLVKAIPAQPVVAATIPICQQGSIPLLINAISGVTGTLKWYDNATGGTGSGTVPKPSADTAGTIKYYVSQTVNNCESPRSALTQEIKALPTRPVATTPIDLCEKGPAQALSATGDNLKWYPTASGGNPSLTAPTPNTNNVATTSFYVSQTKGYPITGGTLSCEGPRAKIDVQVNPLPGLPSVTPPQAVCQERQDKNITFTATGNDLKWYTAPTGGSALGGAPSLNLKESQEKAFYVSQTTAKGCEGSRAEVRIRVKRLPALPGVNPLLEYCQFEKPAQLTATPESNAGLNWYGTSASGGSSSGVAPTPTTDAGGTTEFYVSQTLEGCEGDRTSIKVLVKTTPKPGVTTPVEYCQNVTAQPLSAQGTSLKWYREPASTESQTNPFTPFTANVGTYAFYVTQTGANNCESPKEKIDVRIKPLPSATISGDNSVSLGQSADILVTFTGDGPWDYTLSNGVTGKSVIENPQKITVTPQTTTTYTVTEVANACGKGIPNGSAMVTVRIPTISTGNPTIASLCAGTSFTLPFQASGDFVTANKFNVQISLTEADPGFRTIPTVRQGNDAIATVPDSIPGGNYFVRVVGESPQFIIKGSVSPVTVTVKPRPTATLTGSTTILVGETTTVNITFTGDSPWTFRFNNGQRDSLITTSVTPYVMEVKPSTTTTYTLSTVSNQCGTGRVFGTARIQVDPILGTEPTFSSTWLNVYPSPVQTICVVEMATPLAAGEAQLQVFDVRGRAVFTRKIHALRTEVDFTTQPAGLYLLKIETGGRTAVKRILKQD